MAKHILAIDQGTTSTRAIIFDNEMKIVTMAQKEFTQYYPQPGWVEHDPEEIWESVISVIKQALKKAKLDAHDIAAIGITNQRETAVIWDRITGKPVYNAIVWQDRRTADICGILKSNGHEKIFTRRTGLLLDPYFSGTKVKWILDNVADTRRRAEIGELAFGTIDSFLIWRLTNGGLHACDATNAGRTLLFNIESNEWDEHLCKLLDVPMALLPDVKDCADDFGITDPKLFGASIPIRGVAGDQHAAVIGQACFEPGMVKSTYGTGCFAIMNTGNKMVLSNNRLLSTIAYRLNGEMVYGLEGSIFMAGASVQWLRDEMGIVKKASDTGALAQQADPDQQVYLVPGFVGLGAPYWDSEARGAIYGLTRNAGKAELAKATLEAVCYQTHDLLDAMHKDWQGQAGETVLRVDGGMAASDWTMQCLADILDAPVDRPKIIETTALGAAWLAGSYVGLWPNQEGFAQSWAQEKRFEPAMDEPMRESKLSGWRDAVRRTLSVN